MKAGGLRAPLLVGAAGLGAAVLVRLRDPHRAGSYGWCPFHALTGLWCPGCGGLRAVNDLTHLEVGAALGSNAVVVGLVLGAVVAYALWARRRWRGRAGGPARWTAVLARQSPRLAVVALALIGLFTVLRNTPWGAALAP